MKVNFNMEVEVIDEVEKVTIMVDKYEAMKYDINKEQEVENIKINESVFETDILRYLVDAGDLIIATRKKQLELKLEESNGAIQEELK